MERQDEDMNYEFVAKVCLIVVIFYTCYSRS